MSRTSVHKVLFDNGVSPANTHAREGEGGAV